MNKIYELNHSRTCCALKGIVGGGMFITGPCCLALMNKICPSKGNMKEGEDIIYYFEYTAFGNARILDKEKNLK